MTHRLATLLIAAVVVGGCSSSSDMGTMGPTVHASLLGAQFVLVKAHGQTLPATYATNTQSNGVFYNQIVADTFKFTSASNVQRASFYRAILSTGELTAIDPQGDSGAYSAVGDSIALTLLQGALGGPKLSGVTHGDTLRLSVTWGVSDRQDDVYLRVK